MLRRVQEVEVERKFPAPPQQLWNVYTEHAG